MKSAFAFRRKLTESSLKAPPKTGIKIEDWYRRVKEQPRTVKKEPRRLTRGSRGLPRSPLSTQQSNPRSHSRTRIHISRG